MLINSMNTFDYNIKLSYFTLINSSNTLNYNIKLSYFIIYDIL